MTDIKPSGPRLRVGYVGVAFPSFYGTEHNQYGRAIDGLRAPGRASRFRPGRYRGTRQRSCPCRKRSQRNSRTSRLTF